MDAPITCRGCQALKPRTTEFFYKRSDGVVDTLCKSCVKARAASSAKANPDKTRANHARWRKRNPAKLAARAEAWNAENPTYKHDWHEANAGRINAGRVADRLADPETPRAKDRARYAADPAGRNAHKPAWIEANKDHVIAKLRTNKLLRVYGITDSDYDALLVLQDGKCAICGGAGTTKKKGKLGVDHCHETGTIRGLLCHSCNVGIGLFKDDPARLRAALAYLERRRDATVPHVGE